MKKLICIVFAFLLVVSYSNVHVYAENLTDDSVVLPKDGAYAPNRLIVTFDNTTSLQFKEYSTNDFSSIGCKSINDLSQDVKNQLKSRINNIAEHTLENKPLQSYNGIDPDKYYHTICITLNSSKKSDLLYAIKRIGKMSGVKSVSPDLKMDLCTTPTDPKYSSEQGDIYDHIRLDDAWNINTGSNSVRVAIIDSGIDSTHPDLMNNVNISKFMDFTNGNRTAGSHTDIIGHGTHVAGIIGACANNGIGGSGIAWGVELISLKVFDASQGIYSSWAISAINYASSINCDIINMSIGWGMVPNEEGGATLDNNYNQVMEPAMSSFKGLIVCAAGNNSQVDKNNDNQPFYPANYNLPNQLTVGASNINDERCFFSHYGKQKVDLFAPGYEIFSACSIISCANNNCAYLTGDYLSEHNLYGQGYHKVSGTSMATPIVAGVAALMLSENNELSAQEIKHIIINKGINEVSELSNYCSSGGRINAYYAVYNAGIHSHSYCESEGTQGHYVECTECGFAEIIPHNLYMAFDESDECLVMCRDCEYSIECWDGAIYTMVDANQHHVICQCGCYEFFDDHDMRIRSTGANRHMVYCDDCDYYYTQIHLNAKIATNSLHTHNLNCLRCNYTATEEHTWIGQVGQYRCSGCGMTTAYLPEIMSIPIDESAIE